MAVDNVWPYAPEVGYTETYEFFTEVLRPYSAEQRLSLRKEPRLTLEANHLLSQQQYAQAKLKARRYGQTSSMQIPVWGSQKKFNNLTSGQTVLDFGDDSLLYYQYNKNENVIIWKNWDNYLVRGIASTTPDSLTLDSALGVNYDYAFVMPLRTGINFKGFSSTEDSPNQTYMTSSFTLTEPDETYLYLLYNIYTLDDIYATENIYERPFENPYNDKYVQETAPYRLSSVQDSILEPVQVIDNGFGPLVSEAQFNYINNIQSVEFYFQSQQEKAKNIRDLFSTVKGKLKTWYLPTYNDDVVLISGTYTGTTIDIEDYGVATDYVGRDIMIKETDGTLTYRNVSSATDITSGIELTLDSSVNINSANVDQVCFLNLVRFDTDSFQITHNHAGSGTLRANVIEVPA